MKTILLLATALVLLPGSAMASSSRTAAKDLSRPLASPMVQAAPCTPVNPCAVPTPAIGSVPPLFTAERGARNAPRQTR